MKQLIFAWFLVTVGVYVVIDGLQRLTPPDRWALLLTTNDFQTLVYPNRFHTEVRCANFGVQYVEKMQRRAIRASFVCIEEK